MKTTSFAHGALICSIALGALAGCGDRDHPVPASAGIRTDDGYPSQSYDDGRGKTQGSFDDQHGPHHDDPTEIHGP